MPRLFSLMIIGFFLLCIPEKGVTQSEKIAETYKKLLDFENHRQVDSIKSYVGDFLKATEKEPSSVYRLWALYYYSTIHFMAEQDYCLAITLEAHEGFIHRENLMGTIKTANRLGNIYARAKNDVSSSNHYYRIGLNQVQLNSKNQLADSLMLNYQIMFLNNLTINEMALGHFEEGISLATKAFTYGEKQPITKHHAMTLMNMGNIHFRLRNYSKSIDINRELFIISKKLENEPLIAVSLNNLASNFGMLEQLDSALFYLEKSYKISQKRKDWDAIALKASNIGSVFSKMSQFENAHNYYREALGIAQKYHLLHREIDVIYHMADSYIAQKKPNKAISLLETNIEAVLETKKSPMLIGRYDLMHKAYVLKEDYKPAFAYYKKMMGLQDSLNSINILSKADDLQLKYETEKKERQIAQLQQAQLNQKVSFQRQLLLAGIVFSLLLAMGGFLLFKSSTRSLKNKQKATELEQRLLRSQMNPHFTFNALSSIQTYLLKSGQAQKGAYYLAKFAKLMRQILSQTRTSFISIDEEIQTLENYLSIQKLRYEDSFNYQFTIDEGIDTASTQIPPMLIQPILENAIEHGKVYTLDNGEINIDINQVDGFLNIKIVDNGIGRSSTNASRAKDHESVSMEIILDRIALLREKYGKKVNFRIDDAEKRGTHVAFQLPFILK